MASNRPNMLVAVDAAVLALLPSPSGAEAGSGPAVSIVADYPIRALREGRQGVVYYVLLVGPDGRPKSCTVTTSSGHADLDAAACQSAMRSARFAILDAQTKDQSDRSFSSKTAFKIEE